MENMCVWLCKEALKSEPLLLHVRELRFREFQRLTQNCCCGTIVMVFVPMPPSLISGKDGLTSYIYEIQQYDYIFWKRTKGNYKVKPRKSRKSRMRMCWSKTINNIWPNFKAVLSNLFSDLSCTSVACTLEVVREVWEKAKCWESRYLSSTLNFATTIFYCLELGHATYILWSILYLFLAYKVNTRIVAPLTLCCYCEAIDIEQMCKINSALRMYHCFYQYD